LNTQNRPAPAFQADEFSHRTHPKAGIRHFTEQNALLFARLRTLCIPLPTRCEDQFPAKCSQLSTLIVSTLALFNLAIDSKLRGCDVVAVKVEDVAPNGYTMDRATVRQKKTGRPVKFELTDQTRQAIDDYLKVAGKKPGDFLFNGRHGFGRCMTTRQCARLLAGWIAGIGLDSKLFGTHSSRRTKATLIYRLTGNLRAVQLLLGHAKIESTVSILGAAFIRFKHY
jgi:integrase